MVGPGEYAVAPYFAELIKIATGVGTHTTQVIRLLAFVKNGGKVPEAEEIKELCVDGYLSWQRASPRSALALRSPSDVASKRTLLCDQPSRTSAQT